jgi:hypothetical protein
MTEVTLVGFDGEVVDRREIAEPLPLFINRPTAVPHPDLGFDEEFQLPTLPMGAFGQEPWKVTVEVYQAQSGGTYQRIR